MAVLLVVLACWLFNVRVPWQWEWLKWAWYGLKSPDRGVEGVLV
jgi:hypothetical protein